VPVAEPGEEAGEQSGDRLKGLMSVVVAHGRRCRWGVAPSRRGARNGGCEGALRGGWLTLRQSRERVLTDRWRAVVYRALRPGEPSRAARPLVVLDSSPRPTRSIVTDPEHPSE